MTDRDSAHEPSKSDQSRHWEILARHLSGESTPEEAVRVETMLASRPEDKELLAVVEQAMSALSHEVPAGLDVEAALESVKARRDAVAPVLTVHSNRKPAAPARTRWVVAFSAIAAAAVLAIGLAGWMRLGKGAVRQAAQPAQRFLATGVGVRDSLRLPDGSQIVLGPLSSVSIAAGYGQKSREVEIRGDAWFNVVHNETRPFTVHAGSATIVDVGTKFAVRSDAPDGVAVSVAEGAVSVRPANSLLRQGVVLKAGDNGLVKSGGQVVTRRGGANPDDLAWLSGSLVFREAPIDEVKASMRRWYGLDIRFADSSLARRHITASFHGETPDRVLDVLRLILGAEIERRGDTAIVRPAKGSVRSR